MEPIELRDLEAARRFVAEGLWLQRAARPAAATVRPALEWAMELANEGHPLPPLGFVADLGTVALGADADHRPKDPLHVPGWPPPLARQYEDYVLGRMAADPSFERAADALRGYAAAEQARGVAYLTNKVREHAKCGGVFLPPAVVRGLLAAPPDDVLARGWDDLSRLGPSDPTRTLTDELGKACRRLSELVTPDAIAALEDRSALGKMELEVALGLIRRTTVKLLDRLPARPVRPLAGRREVPTRILDEDQYPVGGYTSISSRGSIESLLHSQLAYMEDAPGEPDLFDVKFARDELFYYSRDENQFLRRRRAFAFVFVKELAEARNHKGDRLPYDALTMTLTLVLAVVTRLAEWLGGDALRFELLFVDADPPATFPAQVEQCRYLFRDWLARGELVIRTVPDRATAAARVADLARQAQTHALVAGPKAVTLPVEAAVMNGLVVNGPKPSLRADDAAVHLEADDPFDRWEEAILRVLQLWL